VVNLNLATNALGIAVEILFQVCPALAMGNLEKDCNGKPGRRQRPTSIYANTSERHSLIRGKWLQKLRRDRWTLRAIPEYFP
jgi:hypothetical protein